MEATHFIRCTSKRPPGSPEWRGGLGSNGLCSCQESAPTQLLLRPIFVIAARARWPCKPHSLAQSLSARRECSGRTTPFSRQFSDCFGPCRLIHYLATAGQGFSRCTWTTSLRRLHWSCGKHKDHLLSTNWQ